MSVETPLLERYIPDLRSLDIDTHGLVKNIGELTGFQTIVKPDYDGGSQDLTVPSSEIQEMSTEEEIMKSPWSRFNQLLVFRRHLRADGKIITKGFGVSMALMPCISSQMAEGIMKETLEIQNPDTQRWDGEEKGEIFCMSKDLEGAPDLPALIGKFIQITGDTIDNKHPFRTHKRVERFLSFQEQRLAFAQVVAEDAQRILDTPEFTGWSSRDKKYKGEGKVYVIEIYVEDGIVYGSCPDGSMMPVSRLPIDQCHRNWIDDGLIPMATRSIGEYWMGADGEDTETVSQCGAEENRGSCSDFFDDMESEEDNIVSTGSNFIQMVDTLGRVHYLCTGCKKVKDNCNCESNLKEFEVSFF